MHLIYYINLWRRTINSLIQALLKYPRKWHSGMNYTNKMFYLVEKLSLTKSETNSAFLKIHVHIWTKCHHKLILTFHQKKKKKCLGIFSKLILTEILLFIYFLSAHSHCGKLALPVKVEHMHTLWPRNFSSPQSACIYRSKYMLREALFVISKIILLKIKGKGQDL